MANSKKNSEKIVEVFQPPGESWLYHASLSRDTPAYRKLYRDAKEYYGQSFLSSSLSDGEGKGWNEALEALRKIAKDEFVKEQNLLNIYFPSKYPIANPSSSSSYGSIIEDLNGALNDKGLYNFAKKITLLRGSGKKRGTYKVTSLVKALSEVIYNSIEQSLVNFLITKRVLYGSYFIHHRKLPPGAEKEISEVIKKGAMDGIQNSTELKDILEKGNEEDKETVEAIEGLMDFYKEFIQEGQKTASDYIEALVEEHLPFFGEQSFVRNLTENFKEMQLKDFDKIIKKTVKDFKITFTTNPSVVARLLEKTQDTIINSLEFSSQKPNKPAILKTVGGASFKGHMASADGVRFDGEGNFEKISKNITEVFNEGKGKDKKEVEEIFEKGTNSLLKRCEEIVKEGGEGNKYSLSFFNMKTLKGSDTKLGRFSAGSPISLNSFSDNLEGTFSIRNIHPLITKIVHFGNGFIFQNTGLKKEGQDIVRLLERLIFFINKTLFDDYADTLSVGSGAAHILLLNHIHIPYSYFLYALIESLEPVAQKDKEVNIRRVAGPSFLATDPNRFVQVEISPSARLIPKSERRKFYNQQENVNIDTIKELWRIQAKEKDKVMIQFTFLTGFERKIKQLFDQIKTTI